MATGQDLKTPSSLESQVVVGVRCRMLLNHEAEALRGPDLRISAGFGRLREISFGSVSCKQLFDHAGTVDIGRYGTESSRCG